MSITDIEPDPDFSAAEAPPGYEFSPQGSTLNALEADEFLPQISDDVDGLLWLGYLTDSFELFGHRFVIKTLTRGERLSTALLTKEFEDTLGMADAYETAQVAASLVEIDSLPLVPLDRNTDPGVQIRANFDRVKGWYDPVIASIFERIVILNTRQQQAFLAFQSK